MDCLGVLLTQGAGPTIRNQVTNRVPLHEAAARGHFDCVELLLKHHAPTKPRVPKTNETPADLARANGHHEVAIFLDKYPVEYHEGDMTGWYHPNIDRKTALGLLNTGKARDGTFLIRNSSKKKRFYVLSMLWQRKGHHFEVEKQGIYYFIDEGPYMMSLEQLVQHYSRYARLCFALKRSRFADGLPCPLSHAVPPEEVSSSLSFSTASWDPVKPARSSPLLPPPSVPTKAPTTPMTEFAASRMFGDMATLRLGEQEVQPEVPPRVPTRRAAGEALPTNLRPIDQVRCGQTFTPCHPSPPQGSVHQ